MVRKNNKIESGVDEMAKAEAECECPDRDCHDRVQASFFTLFGRDGMIGLIEQFSNTKIDLEGKVDSVKRCAGEKLSKNAIWKVVLAFGLAAILGVLYINSTLTEINTKIRWIESNQNEAKDSLAKISETMVRMRVAMEAKNIRTIVDEGSPQ